jgi:hypothetical protein
MPHSYGSPFSGLVDLGASQTARNSAATTIKTAVTNTTKNKAELLIRAFYFL